MSEHAIVMSEDEWWDLCRRIALERRAFFNATGEDQCECFEEDGSFSFNTICTDCADVAIDVAPAKYRVSQEVAEQYDALPGTQW